MKSADLIARTRRAYRRDGIRYVLRQGGKKLFTEILVRLYDQPRRRICVKNGVAVRNVSLIADQDEFPDHERHLINSIREHVEAGSEVVLIGGGGGASSVVASRCVGEEGHVTTFEASEKYANIVRDTIRMNGVAERVTVKHALIETDIVVRGELGPAQRLDATDLPSCDTMVLDCEGAEIEIFENMVQRPDRIVVETHANHGSTEEKVKEMLGEWGYHVVSRGVQDENVKILTLEK